MYAEERRRQIASMTAVEGRVNVTELSEFRRHRGHEPP